MILDFQNIEEIKNQVQQNADSTLPEWKKEIFSFLKWWFSEEEFLSQQTSGSTGTPKEIKLHREVLIASASATISFFQLQEGCSALHCIPAKYIGGKMMLVRAVIGRWKLVCVEPKGDLNSALQRSYKFDFAAMIPLQVQRVLDSESSEYEKLKCLIIGGAAVSSELESEIKKKGLNAYSTYGMTETASHVGLKKLDGKSDFHALEGVKFSTDSDSRLIIEGSRIPDSPLLTNDVVELNSQTSFKWLGRFDNVINSGGVKIVAEELEKIIATLLKEEFYISKRNDSKLGETTVLVIKSDKWSEIKSRTTLDEIKSMVPKYWCPKSIEFLSKFKRTESGKIIRL